MQDGKWTWQRYITYNTIYWWSSSVCLWQILYTWLSQLSADSVTYFFNYPCVVQYHVWLSTHTLNSPRNLLKHLYTHTEAMYKCDKCDKGFRFKSQLTAHKWRHIKDQGFVCMESNGNKCFKHDSELKAHLKTHHKTNIKCRYNDCTYSNIDIHNVRAHRKCHSDHKPYQCPNCDMWFKW